MSPNNTNLQPQAVLDRLFPPLTDASFLTVTCRRSDYSAGAIARAVEDCDCHLLNLNMTAPLPAIHRDIVDDSVVVELRVSHRDPAAVARSLERYGFRVVDTPENTPASDSVTDTMRQRVNELIHYLDV